MRSMTITVLTAATGLALMPAASTTAQTLVFDRGLPDTNLNNVSGANRSNVAWGYGQSGANDFTTGDDFVLPATGDAANPTWEVDTIRMWIIAGAAGDASFSLSQRFLDAELYVGTGGGAVSLAQSGNFIGGNALDNADIVITPVQYSSTPAEDYQTTSGAPAQLWQVDFTNLGLSVNPGELVQFFAFGNAVDPANRAWFNHASNAGLSGTTQDGADDLYSFIQINDLSNIGSVDSNGNGWDKSSDINVQVFAKAVPAPGPAALAGAAGLLMLRRRR